MRPLTSDQRVQDGIRSIRETIDSTEQAEARSRLLTTNFRAYEPPRLALMVRERGEFDVM